eukprot:g4466.t1
MQPIKVVEQSGNAWDTSKAARRFRACLLRFCAGLSAPRRPSLTDFGSFGEFVRLKEKYGALPCGMSKFVETRFPSDFRLHPEKGGLIFYEELAKIVREIIRSQTNAGRQSVPLTFVGLAAAYKQFVKSCRGNGLPPKFKMSELLEENLPADECSFTRNPHCKDVIYISSTSNRNSSAATSSTSTGAAPPEGNPSSTIEHIYAQFQDTTEKILQEANGCCLAIEEISADLRYVRLRERYSHLWKVTLKSMLRRCPQGRFEFASDKGYTYRVQLGRRSGSLVSNFSTPAQSAPASQSGSTTMSSSSYEQILASFRKVVQTMVRESKFGSVTNTHISADRRYQCLREQNPHLRKMTLKSMLRSCPSGLFELLEDETRKAECYYCVRLRDGAKKELIAVVRRILDERFPGRARVQLTDLGQAAEYKNFVKHCGGAIFKMLDLFRDCLPSDEFVIERDPECVDKFYVRRCVGVRASIFKSPIEYGCVRQVVHIIERATSSGKQNAASGAPSLPSGSASADVSGAASEPSSLGERTAFRVFGFLVTGGAGAAAKEEKNMYSDDEFALHGIAFRGHLGLVLQQYDRIRFIPSRQPKLREKKLLEAEEAEVVRFAHHGHGHGGTSCPRFRGLQHLLQLVVDAGFPEAEALVEPDLLASLGITVTPAAQEPLSCVEGILPVLEVEDDEDATALYRRTQIVQQFAATGAAFWNLCAEEIVRYLFDMSRFHLPPDVSEEEAFASCSLGEAARPSSKPIHADSLQVRIRFVTQILELLALIQQRFDGALTDAAVAPAQSRRSGPDQDRRTGTKSKASFFLVAAGTGTGGSGPLRALAGALAHAFATTSNEALKALALYFLCGITRAGNLKEGDKSIGDMSSAPNAVDGSCSSSIGAEWRKKFCLWMGQNAACQTLRLCINAIGLNTEAYKQLSSVLQKLFSRMKDLLLDYDALALEMAVYDDLAEVVGDESDADEDGPGASGAGGPNNGNRNSTCPYTTAERREAQADEAADAELPWRDLPLFPTRAEIRRGKISHLAAAKLQHASVEEFLETSTRLMRAELFSHLLRGLQLLNREGNTLVDAMAPRPSTAAAGAATSTSAATVEQLAAKRKKNVDRLHVWRGECGGFHVPLSDQASQGTALLFDLEYDAQAVGMSPDPLKPGNLLCIAVPIPCLARRGYQEDKNKSGVGRGRRDSGVARGRRSATGAFGMFGTDKCLLFGTILWSHSKSSSTSSPPSNGKKAQKDGPASLLEVEQRAATLTPAPGSGRTAADDAQAARGETENAIAFASEVVYGRFGDSSAAVNDDFSFHLEELDRQDVLRFDASILFPGVRPGFSFLSRRELIAELRTPPEDRRFGPLTSLDDCQLEAVLRALQRRVLSCQGPPGTGKSVVLLILVRLFLSANPNWRVLLVTLKNLQLDKTLSKALEFFPQSISRLGTQSSDAECAALQQRRLAELVNRSPYFTQEKSLKGSEHQRNHEARMRMIFELEDAQKTQVRAAKKLQECRLRLESARMFNAAVFAQVASWDQMCQLVLAFTSPDEKRRAKALCENLRELEHRALFGRVPVVFAEDARRFVSCFEQAVKLWMRGAVADFETGAEAAGRPEMGSDDGGAVDEDITAAQRTATATGQGADGNEDPLGYLNEEQEEESASDSDSHFSDTTEDSSAENEDDSGRTPTLGTYAANGGGTVIRSSASLSNSQNRSRDAKILKELCRFPSVATRGNPGYCIYKNKKGACNDKVFSVKNQKRSDSLKNDIDNGEEGPPAGSSSDFSCFDPAALGEDDGDDDGCVIQRLLAVRNPALLRPAHRRLLMRAMVKRISADFVADTECAEKAFRSAALHVEKLRKLRKQRVLKQQQIVGVTIDGCAIHADLIQAYRPDFIIVEEAGEVGLEKLAPLLLPRTGGAGGALAVRVTGQQVVGSGTSNADNYNKKGLDIIHSAGKKMKQIAKMKMLSKKKLLAQQLILIGDHKQLGPIVHTFDLVKKYGFGKSVMERLVTSMMDRQVEREIAARNEADESAARTAKRAKALATGSLSSSRRNAENKNESCRAKTKNSFAALVQLSVQHRMVPELAKHLRPLYDHNYTDEPHIEVRLQPETLMPFGRRVFFWDLGADDLRTKEELPNDGGHGYRNPQEADAVLRLAFYLLVERGIFYGDICILTPYQGQLTELQKQLDVCLKKLERRGVLERVLQMMRLKMQRAQDPGKDVHEDTSKGLKGTRDREGETEGRRTTTASCNGLALAEKMTVNELKEQLRKAWVSTSVDGSQGQEWRYVLVSLVRTAASGFLGEKQAGGQSRLVVLQSRAQCALVLVGNAQCLEYNAPKTRKRGAPTQQHLSNHTQGLSLNEVWSPLLTALREDNALGRQLALCCPNPQHHDGALKQMNTGKDDDEGHTSHDSVLYCESAADLPDLFDGNAVGVGSGSYSHLANHNLSQTAGAQMKMKIVCARPCEGYFSDHCGHKCPRRCHFGTPCLPSDCNEIVIKKCQLFPDRHPALRTRCGGPFAVSSRSKSPSSAAHLCSHTEKRLCRFGCGRMVEKPCFELQALLSDHIRAGAIATTDERDLEEQLSECFYCQLEFPCKKNPTHRLVHSCLETTEDDVVCDHPCGRTLPCGHPCPLTCGRCGFDACREGVKCKQQCAGTAKCGHPCLKKCGHAGECGPSGPDECVLCAKEEACAFFSEIVDEDDEIMDEQLRQRLPLPVPLEEKWKPSLVTVRLDHIRYAQKTISDRFRNGKSIFAVRDEIMKKPHLLENFPRLNVVFVQTKIRGAAAIKGAGEDGVEKKLCLTMDHRRLWLLKQLLHPQREVEVMAFARPEYYRGFDRKMSTRWTLKSMAENCYNDVKIVARTRGAGERDNNRTSAAIKT